MLNTITPVILTYNEEANIGRALDRLSWANKVVVVDSLSSDSTKQVAMGYENVRFIEHEFQAHAAQWNYAVQDTGIDSDWILALDADYILTDDLVEELKVLEPPDDVAGFRVRFIYCVFGRRLRGSIYPPVVVLYRRQNSSYIQDGHTQRLVPSGRVENLDSPILHDDRKSLRRWLISQSYYMKLQSKLITEKPWRDLGWNNRLRRGLVLSPFLVFMYSMFLKRGFMDGRAGLFYAIQKSTAEMILSVYLIKEKLNKICTENGREF